MGNPTKDGMYDEYDNKHDCPRPMVGCRFPKCDCDVDNDYTSHKELKALGEDIEQYETKGPDATITEEEIEEALAEIEKDMQERDYEDIDVEKYTDG